MGVRQLQLGLPDALGHLGEKLVVPVGHEDPQLDGLNGGVHLLLVGLPGRHIPGVPDGVQNSLPDVRAHIGAVIQNTVNGTPGHPGQVRYHLDRDLLSHTGPP